MSMIAVASTSVIIMTRNTRRLSRQWLPEKMEKQIFVSPDSPKINDKANGKVLIFV